MSNMRSDRPSSPSPSGDAPRTPREANLVTAAGDFPFSGLVSFQAPRLDLAMSPRTVPIFFDGLLALSAT